jgi:hypothetical protein
MYAFHAVLSSSLILRIGGRWQVVVPFGWSVCANCDVRYASRFLFCYLSGLRERDVIFPRFGDRGVTSDDASTVTQQRERACVDHHIGFGRSETVGMAVA